MAPILRRAAMPLLASAAAALAFAAPTAATPSAAERAAASAAATPSTPLGGINIGGLDYRSSPAVDQAIATARRLHAQVVRAEVPWAVMEPNRAGEVDPQALALTDHLVADAAASGIKVIAMVQSTPCWDSSAPSALLAGCSPGQLTAANSWPPRHASAYASFVAFLAQRYGTELAAIEVWNEPDQINQRYFAGPEKAKRYATLLRAAYPAIKQANPNVLVLGGSLVGSNGVFLRALYAAGIKGYYDALAVHFYTLTLASLRAFRHVQLENGDTKPLWLDEFGWSSCWPAQHVQQEQGCVTERTQALNITNIFRSLARTSYVAAEVIYKLQDRAGEDFGVLSRRGAQKPSFAALASALLSPIGRVSPVTVHLRRSGGRLVASGSGPVGDLMALEAFAGGSLRYRAVFTLDRFNHYTIHMPAALGTRGLLIRVYQYWSGLSRAAVARV